MNRQELDNLLRGAISAVNVLSDELGIMYGLFDQFAAGDDPLCWTPTGRTYARTVTAGKGAKPRALPQAIYRMYLPSGGAAVRADSAADDDDRVHLRVDKRTRILVIASCFYSLTEPSTPPQLVSCALQNFGFPSWGVASTPPTGLRRTHLRQLIETLDLAAVAEPMIRIESLTVGPRQKLSCDVEVLLREPLTAITDGKALQDIWRRVTSATSSSATPRRRPKAERSLHVQ